jgi:hypothetical protein
MSVPLPDERTPIGVTDALGYPLRPVARGAHQRDGRVPKLVEAERVLACCFDRGLPHLVAQAVPIPRLVLLVGEEQRRPCRACEQLLLQ